MKQFVSNQVINGTWGELWVDDEYIGEVVSCKGEVSISYSDISMVRSLTAGKKMTKLEGKGSIKLHHIRSNRITPAYAGNTVKRSRRKAIPDYISP